MINKGGSASDLERDSSLISFYFFLSWVHIGQRRGTCLEFRLIWSRVSW